MFRVPSISGLFKWRQFEPELILLAVGWYLRFSLSYRDVEKLLAERGLRADHVTVWRSVQRYAPELQRCLRRHLKPTNDSWRMDETYVRVKGKWRYLYRAVDSSGRSQALSCQSARQSKPSAAASDQHRRPRRVSARRRAAQNRRRSRRGLPASTGAKFEQRARAGPPRHQAAGQ